MNHPPQLRPAEKVVPKVPGYYYQSNWHSPRRCWSKHIAEKPGNQNKGRQWSRKKGRTSALFQKCPTCFVKCYVVCIKQFTNNIYISSRCWWNNQDLQMFTVSEPKYDPPFKSLRNVLGWYGFPDRLVWGSAKITVSSNHVSHRAKLKTHHDKKNENLDSETHKCITIVCIYLHYNDDHHVCHYKYWTAVYHPLLVWNKLLVDCD